MSVQQPHPAIQRYRKRPLTVEAVLWDGTEEREKLLFEWTGSSFHAVPPEDRHDDPDVTAEVYDRFHSTWVGVKTGQHVVRSTHGEFYPIDQEVLNTTYVRIETNT